jgi:hypothetical protein
MKNLAPFLAAISMSLLLGGTSARATSFNITTGTTTSQQTLNGGETGNVGSNGTLKVGGSNVAVTLAGSSTLTNSGTITQTSTGRAVRLTSNSITVTITNNTGALINAAGNDGIQYASGVTNSNITINNHGTIQAAGGNQAVDLNNQVSGTGTVTNYFTGTITDAEDDAVRPGINGVVINSGTIKSTTVTGASADGIDGQSNSGIQITNAATLTDGVGATNLIEGGRHGITGGNTGTSTSSPTYADSTNPTTPGVYTMSITNNLGGTIQGDNGSGINIDGFGGKNLDPNNLTKSVTFEVINVTNHGTITGNGVSGDGDGIDIDGAVILNNTGTITSKNSTEFSEGVTVGGGTIVNGVGGVITGTTTAGSTGVGRGITIAGVDKGADDTDSKPDPIPLQSAYAYHDLTTGSLVDPTISNSGLIRGASESGIAVLGTTGGALTVTITNSSTGTIEGNNTGVSEDTVETTGSAKGQLNGQSLNQAAIELDDTSNTYIVTNSGTITQDNLVGGTAVAMHGVSNTLNVTGGTASIVGNISGNTVANNTLNLTPGAGNSFSYGYKISNFAVNINADGSTGTVTLSGANDYTGSTTLGGGTTYVNNASGSGTGVGSMLVKATATLAGTGTIKPTGTSAITVAAGGILAPGGVQPAPVSDETTNAANGNLKIDTTNFTPGTGVKPNTVLSLTNAKLTFALGSGDATSGSKLVVTGGVANTVAFTGTSTVTINDLVDANLTLNQKYVLIQGDDTTYTGLQFGDPNSPLLITGGLSLLAANTPGNFFSEWYGTSQLFLDGDNIVIDVVPEPQTWATLLGGFILLAFVQARRRAAMRVK